MKRSAFLSLLLLLPAIATAGITEWYSVVRVTDNFKGSSYAVMTNAEFTKLTQELWARNRVLTTAIQKARDEWIKGEDTKDKVYPVNITCTAEAKRLKTFPDMEQATAYVAVLEAQDAAKVADKKSTTYLEKRIRIIQDELENPSAALSSQYDWRRVRKEELGVLLAEKAERDAKESVKRQMEDNAKGLIEAQIVALLAAPTAQTQPIML